MRLQIGQSFTDEDGRPFAAGQVYEVAAETARRWAREGRDVFPPEKPPTEPETGETFDSWAELEDSLAGRLRSAERQVTLAEREVEGAEPPVEDIERDLRRVERELGELEAEVEARRKAVDTLEGRLASAESELSEAEEKLEDARERARATERRIERVQGGPGADRLGLEVEATDAARELAAEHGLSLAEIEGSGEDGRIVKSDVEEAI